MNDILKTYMERFRENRHTLRRYTAFVLALAMITTLFVNWQLHGVGISMTAQYPVRRGGAHPHRRLLHQGAHLRLRGRRA